MTDLKPCDPSDFQDALAYALDRHGLKAAGWTVADIDRAMEAAATPSRVNRETVAVIWPMIQPLYALDRDAILEQAAVAVAAHDRTGREWVKGSLWDDITMQAVGRIRALKGQGR